MALTKERLDEARQRLSEELAHVETELTDLGFPVGGEVEVKFDEGFADAAQATSERAKVLSIVDGLRHRHEDLLAAVSRIDKGTYGICSSCEEPISQERMEAVPTATLCISCKQKQK